MTVGIILGKAMTESTRYWIKKTVTIIIIIIPKSRKRAKLIASKINKK